MGLKKLLADKGRLILINKHDRNKIVLKRKPKLENVHVCPVYLMKFVIN